MHAATLRRAAHLGIAALLILLAPTPSSAGDSESALERDARLARRAAGLRVGSWNVTSLEETAGGERSRTPHLEGFFQKGLDRHLAWINNVALWRRTQETTTSGGITGGTSTETVQSYVIPFFTALKFHPLTGPDARWEPFVDAGAGFALGIADRKVEGDASLLGPGAPGTSLQTGFGFRATTGVDLRLSHMFGATVQGRYQWVKFTQNLGDDDTFEGFGIDLGLTYRFQY